MNNGIKKVLINTILMICVTAFFTLIGYVVASDINSRDRDTKIDSGYKEANRLRAEACYEADRKMTEQNTKAFNGQIQATNELKVTIGKLDTTIGSMSKQLEKIANGN